MAQWEESKHPRDGDGKFTTGGGTPAEHKRLQEMGIENKNNAKSKVKITYSEEATILSYFSSESYKINEKLYTHAELTEQDRKFIKNLDSALKKMPFVNNIKLVRDLKFPSQNKKESFFNSMLGWENKIIKNISYWSATKDEEYHKIPDVRMVFEKASKARDVKSLEGKGENEAIYERNSLFKIVDIKITKCNNHDICVINLKEVK